jgi:hypothetical protein
MGEDIDCKKSRKTRLLGYGNNYHEVNMRITIIKLIVEYKKMILHNKNTKYASPTEEECIEDYFNNNVTHDLVNTICYNILKSKITKE